MGGLIFWTLVIIPKKKKDFTTFLFCCSLPSPVKNFYKYKYSRYFLNWCDVKQCVMTIQEWSKNMFKIVFHGLYSMWHCWTSKTSCLLSKCKAIYQNRCPHSILWDLCKNLKWLCLRKSASWAVTSDLESHHTCMMKHFSRPREHTHMAQVIVLWRLWVCRDSRIVCHCDPLTEGNELFISPGLRRTADHNPATLAFSEMANVLWK